VGFNGPDVLAELDLERHKFLVTAELLDALPAKPMNLEEQRREIAQALIDDRTRRRSRRRSTTTTARTRLEIPRVRSIWKEQKKRIRHLMVHAVMVVMAISPSSRLSRAMFPVRQFAREKSRKRKLKSATHTTYGLFTLGWGLD